MTTDTTTIARRIFDEVFNTNAVARMDEFAHADVVINYAGAAEPIRSLPAYKALFLADIPSFPDARYTILDLFGAGDRIAVRWQMAATHQGTYQGHAPTGQRVTLSGMSIYRFVEGKVAEGWMVADNLSFLQQLRATTD